MDESSSNNTELTDEQVTELYENIQSPQSSNIPMDNNEAPATTDAKSWDLAEGVSVSEEQLLEYAKKGHAGNADQDAWMKERDEFNPVMDKYKGIDDYAIENPEWFEHVQKSYSERDQNNDTISQNPELQNLQNELTDIKQFIQSQRNEAQQKQISEEDNLLDAEINGVKEKHSYMDFSTKNEAGFTLEQQVLKHAQEIGTSSFQAAFRDYAHDQLLAKAQELGKESIGKDIQRKTKLGILGQGKSEAVSDTGNDKGKSYDLLAKEGLAMFGIT